MKTSIEIDEKKVKLAKKITRVDTLRELIDLALDAYIAQARRQSMTELLGTDFFNGDLEKMRKRYGRSG